MDKTLPSNAGNVGLIPSWGTKIPLSLGQKNPKTKQEQYCNKFNEDNKNGPYQKNIKNKTGRTDWTGNGRDREHGGHSVLQPTEHMAWMDQSLSLKKKNKLFIWLYQVLVVACGI